MRTNKDLQVKFKKILEEYLLKEELRKAEELFDTADNIYWELIYDFLEKSCSLAKSKEVKVKFEKKAGKDLVNYYQEQHRGFPCVLNPNFEDELEEACTSCQKFWERAENIIKLYLETFAKMLKILKENRKRQ